MVYILERAILTRLWRVGRVTTPIDGRKWLKTIRVGLILDIQDKAKYVAISHKN